MSSYICKSAGIVGAGIQGICTGLQLLKKNIPVKKTKATKVTATKIKKNLKKHKINKHDSWINLL